jgi:hypothetical protein
LAYLFKADTEMKMKIVTFARFQMTDKVGEYIPVSEVSYEYAGPLALADRAAQSRAKDLADTSEQTASKMGSNADTEHGQLEPFFAREMTAQHAFDPNQTNELLTAAEAGSGGALGGMQGEIERHAAATGNGTALTKTLQDLSRDRAKAAAGSSEGIAAQDVLGAQQLRQQGAQGMSGLYGTDTNGMLNAMGVENNAINSEIEAGKSGWLQNLTSVMKALPKPKGWS